MLSAIPPLKSEQEKDKEGRTALPRYFNLETAMGCDYEGGKGREDSALQEKGLFRKFHPLGEMILMEELRPLLPPSRSSRPS